MPNRQIKLSVKRPEGLVLFVVMCTYKYKIKGLYCSLILNKIILMSIKIKEVNIKNSKLSIIEKKNLNTLVFQIAKLEEKEEFNKTIGLQLFISEKSSTLQVSAFTSEHLSEFLTILMIGLRNEDLNVSYSVKNIEGLFSPVYTNIITLDVK